MYQHIARDYGISCKKRHHERAFSGMQKCPYYTPEKALSDHEKQPITAQKAPFHKRVWRRTTHKHSETAFPYTFSGLSIFYFSILEISTVKIFYRHILHIYAKLKKKR